MKNIKVKNLGPIANANINFGDLTFFIGPQASGKSILLQLIKLIADKDVIETKLKNYGYVWGTVEDNNLERFFGEGMDGIWDKRTSISSDGHLFEKKALLPKPIGPDTAKEESIFYMPSQRATCLDYGWPRYFKEFDDSAPYVLRDFSETLRQYLELGFTHGKSPVFPQKDAMLKWQLANAVNKSIFHTGKVTVEQTVKKRLKLDINGLSLPYLAWSTGQKEVMPLLMGFYWLSPANGERRVNIDTVIIEEPEMGLHPGAIKAIILQIIDLLSRGYKVIVSTHSPVLLEFTWAFQILKSSGASETALLELFDLDKGESNFELVNGILQTKTIKTYYFENVDYKVTVKDISSLDAGSLDPAVAEWGGLSSFASRASEIVSSIVAK